MPKQCSICTHPKRKEIEKAIAEKKTLREITGKYGPTRSSLQRHKECIAEALQTVNETLESITVEAVREGVTEQVQKGTLQTAVTVESVVGRLFDVLLKLLDACDRDLRDPDEPTVYNLMPRAQEIEIIWEKNEAAPDEKPRWVKQKSTLQAALDVAFTSADRRLARTEPVTHNDRAKELRATTAQLNKQAEFLAKLEGRFLPVEKELGSGNTIQLAMVVNILVQNGLLKG